MKTEEFIIGENDFLNIEIKSSANKKQFYYFFNKESNNIIDKFVLLEKERVDYFCCVKLIKKGDKITPRLTFSVRDKTFKRILEEKVLEDDDNFLKANVSLAECHENFWKLIGFLQSLRGLDIPKEIFSLVLQEDNDIISALNSRNKKSIINIIKQLSSIPGVNITQEDINIIIKRKEKLNEFAIALEKYSSDEKWWQNFFEDNKWIFGYALDYCILRQEQPQPYYGGCHMDGKGGQRGDYLVSTKGDLNFTVLVEIKTPATLLLQGTEEIRNGAWSLSKKFTDAVSQIEANISTWERDGSKQESNKDILESKNIFTVKPKGIIVIGLLSQFSNIRSKRETFQRFRKSIHGIDIITFDELYERAKFIVENKS